MWRQLCRLAVASLAVASIARPVLAESLTGADLLQTLRNGGCVLIMRHANSPSAPPDATHANADNKELERQLDTTGREDAGAIGAALRQLNVPIAKIYSSPTYRARETVRLMAALEPVIASELSEGGVTDMKASTDADRANWLRRRAAESPPKSTNLLYVTHAPNVLGAFRDAAKGTEPGEILVARGDGHGEAQIVARIKPKDWPQLLAAGK